MSNSSRRTEVRRFLAHVLKIDSTDKIILEQIKKSLENFGIRVNLYLKSKKGFRNGVKYSKDLYSLVVYRKQDVVSLANKTLPLSRHEEKVALIKLISNNENSSWGQIGNKFIELRNHIKETRLK